jgi:hypothetical protein
MTVNDRRKLFQRSLLILAASCRFIAGFYVVRFLSVTFDDLLPEVSSCAWNWSAVIGRRLDKILFTVMNVRACGCVCVRACVRNTHVWLCRSSCAVSRSICCHSARLTEVSTVYAFCISDERLETSFSAACRPLA